MCIDIRQRSYLKTALSDLQLQGHLGYFHTKSHIIGPVRAIIPLVFGLESPNLQHMCIMAQFVTPLKMGQVDLDLRCYLAVKLTVSMTLHATRIGCASTAHAA